MEKVETGYSTCVPVDLGKVAGWGFFSLGGKGDAVVDEVASYCWRLGLGIVVVGTLGKGKGIWMWKRILKL